MAIGEESVITLIDGRVTRGNYAATKTNGQIVFRDKRSTSTFDAKDLKSVMPVVIDESMQLARLAVHARTVRDDYSGLVSAWRRAREIAVKVHLGEVAIGLGGAEDDLKLAKEKLEECHKRFHNLWDRLLTYAPDMAERYPSLGAWTKDEPSAEQLVALERMAQEATERAKDSASPPPLLAGPVPASLLPQPIVVIERPTAPPTKSRPDDEAETSLSRATVRPQALADGTGVAKVDADAHAYSWRLCGELWEIRYGDEHGHFRNRMGFRLIVKLLRFPNPTRPLTAIELKGSDQYVGGASHTPQAAMDADAIADLREQIAEYGPEVEDAVAADDEPRADLLRREQQELVDHLNKVQGIGGSIRSLGPASPGKSAQVAVGKAIQRAYDAMRRPMPKLREHLMASISTGQECAYRPSTTSNWKFD